MTTWLYYNPARMFPGNKHIPSSGMEEARRRAVLRRYIRMKYPSLRGVLHNALEGVSLDGLMYSAGVERVIEV